MKKLIALTVIMCFAATCSAAWGNKSTGSKTPGTETKKESVGLIIWNGRVTSVNIPQNEVVVKDDKSTYDKVFIVKPEVFNTVKVGDAVELKTKPDSSIVENFKVTKAAQADTPVTPAKKKK